MDDKDLQAVQLMVQQECAAMVPPLVNEAVERALAARDAEAAAPKAAAPVVTATAPAVPADKGASA